MDETSMLIVMGILLVICIVVLCIICYFSTKNGKKWKSPKEIMDEQIEVSKHYFTEAGYTVSKCINNLLIDDVNRKWLVAGSDRIFSYDDVISVKIMENGSQIEVGALSVHSTIKTMSVLISTADTLNALVNIPIFELKGNAGLETSSYEYAKFKETAMEQEAFFNAVISQKCKK